MPGTAQTAGGLADAGHSRRQALGTAQPGQDLVAVTGSILIIDVVVAAGFYQDAVGYPRARSV